MNASSTDLKHFEPIGKAIQTSNKLVIYEGLPHPWDAELLQQEKQRGNSITLHNNVFYSQRLSTTENERSAITQLITSAETLHKLDLEQPKLCGPFHADWCFEWQTGAQTYHGLLCFNCLEMKFFGPNPHLHCDILPGPAKRLKALLEKFRTNRPKDAAYDVLLAD